MPHTNSEAGPVKGPRIRQQKACVVCRTAKSEHGASPQSGARKYSHSRPSVKCDGVDNPPCVVSDLSLGLDAVREALTPSVSSCSAASGTRYRVAGNVAWSCVLTILACTRWNASSSTVGEGGHA